MWPNPPLNRTAAGGLVALGLLVRPMHLSLADSSDVAILYEIRQAAILQLSLTRLSKCEAVAWAACGGIPRVEPAVAKDEVWVATFNARVVAWIHRAANSIEGLYVWPTVARQGVGASLVRLAEDRIAQQGDHVVVLESSLNAVQFYVRLGYALAGVARPSGALPMRKYLEAA
jgi:putative acetyltransferase